MGARSMFRRRIPLWTAAILLGSGLTAAHADDDTFFSDLAKADAAPTRVAEAAPAHETPPSTAAPTQPAAKPVPSTGTLIQHGLTPGDTTGAIAPRQPFDRAEWLPGHAASPADAAKPAQTQAAGKAADKVDPEPDVAIVPPAEPSKDPLDHPAVPAAAPAPAPEALPPLNAALKAALDKRDGEPVHGPGAGERRKERAAVSFFYAAHGFAPVWSTDGKAAEAVPSVLARLIKAGDDALTLPTPVPSALEEPRHAGGDRRRRTGAHRCRRRLRPPGQRQPGRSQGHQCADRLAAGPRRPCRGTRHRQRRRCRCRRQARRLEPDRTALRRAARQARRTACQAPAHEVGRQAVPRWSEPAYRHARQTRAVAACPPRGRRRLRRRCRRHPVRLRPSRKLLPTGNAPTTCRPPARWTSARWQRSTAMARSPPRARRAR